MNISQGQTTTLTAQPIGVSGNPTTLPPGDVPVWAVDAPSVVDVTPSVDGLSLVVLVHKDAPAGDINFQITDAIIARATGAFVLTVSAPAPESVASFAITASVPA